MSIVRYGANGGMMGMRRDLYRVADDKWFVVAGFVSKR